MMTKVELKKKIKKRINAIDDNLLLKELLRIVGTEEDNDEAYHFSKEQKVGALICRNS